MPPRLYGGNMLSRAGLGAGTGEPSRKCRYLFSTTWVTLENRRHTPSSKQVSIVPPISIQSHVWTSKEFHENILNQKQV